MSSSPPEQEEPGDTTLRGSLRSKLVAEKMFLHGEAGIALSKNREWVDKFPKSTVSQLAEENAFDLEIFSTLS